MQDKRQSGFTFIELVITVAILGVLVAAATPMLELTLQRSKEQELRLALRQIREAIDAYKKAADEGRIVKKVDESGYPHKLEELASGIEDTQDPKKRKIYFLRRLPADPMFEGETANAASTWGKRSYESSADQPREGQDVFDVYSLSKRKGLNGIPYRDW
jgi:general secretion pathway protein G